MTFLRKLLASAWRRSIEFYRQLKAYVRKLLPPAWLQRYEYYRYPIRRPLKPCLAGRYVYREQEGSDKIKALLEKNKPCLVARFGWNEIYIVMEFLQNCRKNKLEFNPDYRRMMHEAAGFFPDSNQALARFASESLEIVKHIDILGVVGQRGDEYLIKNYNPNITPVEIQCMGDHIAFLPDPWTLALRHKKILVIHPFAASIEQQYAKRKLLFAQKEVLPEFELLTLPAVLSNGGASVKLPYQDWFEALAHMCEQIDQLDFDVALVGAGAYGMFLAAHCKKIGKQALHLGGALQLLFGIKGGRWEKEYPPEFSARLFNEHWRKPSAEETPPEAEKVENACYW